jgi:hypothetical protein
MHLIVVPQQSGGWQHTYSTKAMQIDHANEQPIYSLLSLVLSLALFSVTHFSQTRLKSSLPDVNFKN